VAGIFALAGFEFGYTSIDADFADTATERFTDTPGIPCIGLYDSPDMPWCSVVRVQYF